MASTTTSTEAELLAAYWKETFLNELRANLVFDQFALKSSHPTGSGTMIHWLALADLSSAAALTEATDPTEYSLSAGDQTATLAQYGATVKVSDILEDTWIKTSMQNLMERLARNAALTKDTILRNAIFSAGGTAQYGGTAVARNSIATDSSFDMTLAKAEKATTTMGNSNVPRFKDGYYVGVLHPHVAYDLMRDDDFKSFSQYTDMGLEKQWKWEVGSMAGIRFVQSTQALLMDASGSASTDVYQSYIFGDEYFGVSELHGVDIVIQDTNSTLNLYKNYGWKASWAQKQLSDSRMIRLETGSSLGD